MKYASPLRYPGGKAGLADYIAQVIGLNGLSGPSYFEPFAEASAVHLAVLKDNREFARVLLDNVADIDIRARDTYQGSPLEWAVFFGIKEMAMFLVESGADVEAENVVGTTPWTPPPTTPLSPRKGWRSSMRAGLSSKNA